MTVAPRLVYGCSKIYALRDHLLISLYRFATAVSLLSSPSLLPGFVPALSRSHLVTAAQGPDIAGHTPRVTDCAVILYNSRRCAIRAGLNLLGQRF
jgi:hypothetical protein